MKDVLDAVDDRGPVGAFENVHDAFEPEKIGAAMLAERLKKQRQRHRPDRIVTHDRIGVDAMTLRGVLMRRGRLSQPRSDIERLGEGIVEAGGGPARRGGVRPAMRPYGWGCGAR